MSTIGILFDIEALGGGLYGYSAYKALFETIDTRLIPSSTLADGDTAASISGRDNHYCIAITCGDPRAIERVQDALSRARANGALPAVVRFIDGDAAAREPLVPAAEIDAAGALVSAKPRWIREAWETARKARANASGAAGGEAGAPTELVRPADQPGHAAAPSASASAAPAGPAASAPFSARSTKGAPVDWRSLPFTGLFDIPRFGLNRSIGVALLLTYVFAEFSWMIPVLARGDPVGFNPAGYYLLTFGFDVLEAAVFVAAVHTLRRPLPLVAAWSGFALVRGVLWRAIFTTFPILPGGRLGVGIFEPALLLRAVVYGAVFMTALILAVRTWKVTLKAFLAGGVAALLVPTLLMSWSRLRQPGGFEWASLLMLVANGLVMGGLLYAGLLRHYRRRGIEAVEDTVRAAAATGRASTFYYVCCHNRSLINAFAEIFSVVTAVGWGRSRQYRLSLTDGRVDAARQLARERNQAFDGAQYLGTEREGVARMDDLLGRLQAAGDREMHVLFAEMTDARASWVHEAYNTLLADAMKQGILPFRMYSTKNADADAVLQGLFSAS